MSSFRWRAAVLLLAVTLCLSLTHGKEIHPHSSQHYKPSLAGPPQGQSEAKKLSEIYAASFRQAEKGLDIRRQAATGSTEVKLQKVQTWLWGGDSKAVNKASGQNAILNLTGIATENERWLSEEEFSDSLSSVECSNSTIKFTFTDSTASAAAQESWQWLNAIGNRSVGIVLRADTCGNTRRQPYKAGRMSFDNLTATAQATKRRWGDVLSTGKLHYNTQGLDSQSALDGGLESKADEPELHSLDVAKDFSGKTLFERAIRKNSSLTTSVGCKECRTRGRLDIEIEADLGFFKVEKASVKVTPTGLGADVVFDITVGGEITSGLSAEIDLPPIPLGPIPNVGELLRIGPAIRLLGQASLDAVSAETTLSLGAKMDFPDDSVAKMDFKDSSKNEFSGWTPSFTAVEPEVAGQVTISANMGPRINLELSLEFLGGFIDAGASAGLSLGAPQLQVSLAAQADTAGGVCDTPEAHLGVDIDVGLSAELDAFGGFGDPKDLPNKIPLLSTSTPLFSTCRTIGGSAPTGAPESEVPDYPGSELPGDSTIASPSTIVALPSTTKPAGATGPGISILPAATSTADSKPPPASIGAGVMETGVAIDPAAPKDDNWDIGSLRTACVEECSRSERLNATAVAEKRYESMSLRVLSKTWLEVVSLCVVVVLV